MNACEKHIIRKLFFRRCIGGKHTAIEHALAGIPRERTKEGMIALHDLARQNILLLKPTSYGLQCSLNPRRMSEIKRALED